MPHLSAKSYLQTPFQRSTGVNSHLYLPKTLKKHHTFVSFQNGRHEELTSFRHILASLLFNENVKRETQRDKDGKPYYKVTYPKFKLGEEVVREVAIPPTYGKYINLLAR